MLRPRRWGGPGSPAIAILFLIRHAAHADFGLRLTGRAPGVPLTPQGRAQADALARRLAPEGLAEVRTSPRERARETAAAVADAAGAPLVVEPLLDEIDFGDWTGRSFASLAGDPAWDRWNEARATQAPPGGEAMAAAADRALGLVAGLAEGNRRVAFVSHCDVIRGLVARVLGLSLDHVLRFDVSPASVSRVEAGSWGARLLSLNEGAA